ncbi:MAG: crossover junction endodeoxyribonuclease RuvC [Candidatus Pacebacteria bacterium]|nr:crossover junction endodeoxyribonuclease RuvC [Candidatus Paceibacterota bacterium]
MIILGIDQGIATTGYGVVKLKTQQKLLKSQKIKDSNFQCLELGCILTDQSKRFSLRLKKMSSHLRTIIKKYNPDICAIETLFFFQNKKTAIQVSQAAGVTLYTLEQCGIPVVEFSPQEVKKSLTNNGWAKKQHIQEKVKKIFKLKEIPYSDDAADALAIAYYCAKRYIQDNTIINQRK